MIWLQLAWRDLLRNPRRSVFALAIVIIGTMASLAAAGYVLTTFHAVRDATIHQGLGHLHIATAAEFDGYEEQVLENGLTRWDAERIERVVRSSEHVELTLPRLTFQGIASSGDRSLVALGEGVDPLQERRLTAAYDQLIAGGGFEPLTQSVKYQALIGQEMARLLAVSPGDLVTILATSSGGGLNAIDVEVAGIFSSGVPQLDRMRLVVPLETAQELLQTEKVRRIAVALDETDATDRVAMDLERRLPGLVVKRWYELAPLYRQLVALYSRQAAVFGVVIGTIVLLVVFGAIAMGVLERRRDIGTLLSLGIPATRIRWMFLVQGALLGGLGGVSGGLLAFILFSALNAAHIEMPPAPGYTESYPLFIAFRLCFAAVAILAATALGLLASWQASRQVTRQNIIDAMSRI